MVTKAYLPSHLCYSSDSSDSSDSSSSSDKNDQNTFSPKNFFHQKVFFFSHQHKSFTKKFSFKMIFFTNIFFNNIIIKKKIPNFLL